MAKSVRVSDRQRTRDLLSEMDKRKMEALRLYRPLDYQECIFHTDCSELVVLGGNRSAKTLSCSIKFTSELLRVPVTFKNGAKSELFCPKTPLLAWVIGKHENHIGTTIYDTLFKPGLFRVIKDKQTGDWRTFRPWDNKDWERKDETEDSEPLIPDRYIKAHAWKDRKAHVYEEVTLVNNNVIRFYSSQAEAKQGDKVDYIWIDEDIEYEEHVAEWQARLSDKEGRLMWSAYPHSSNNALADMVERAENQIARETPDSIVIRLTFSQNPFIVQNEKRKRLEQWSDDDKRARDLGEFTFDSQLVYPTYDRAVHLTPPEEEGKNWDAVDRMMASGERPHDWCRDLVIDPGFNNPCVLICAVPPPEFGDYLIIEDEIYPKKQNLDQLCRLIKPKLDGHIFERFIIDGRAARQTPMTGGPTYRQQFADAFKEFKFVCRSTGSDFILGSDNIEARLNLVRSALAVDLHTGKPRLRLSRSRTRNGCQFELMRYKYRMDKTRVTDKIVARYDHAMDCLGYWIASRPTYVRPEHNDKTVPSILRRFRKLLGKSAPGSGSIQLGPTTA